MSHRICYGILSVIGCADEGLSANNTKGCAVLVSMHDLNLVARYCDDLLLLSKADVCSFGSPDKVLRANVLHEVFGL